MISHLSIAARGSDAKSYGFRATFAANPKFQTNRSDLIFGKVTQQLLERPDHAILKA